ncbi:MAG: hypothetical protein F4Y96_07870 [Chloroflexi bacterium]|nr:hypothetical protein [Chloroflexota bacterium]
MSHLEVQKTTSAEDVIEHPSEDSSPLLAYRDFRGDFPPALKQALYDVINPVLKPYADALECLVREERSEKKVVNP